MPKKNKFFGRILKNIVNQIIPVMIGVYLGFALNNYGESQKMKKQKDTFEKMLFNEVIGNLENAKKSLPYHLSLKQEIDSLAKEEHLFEAFDNYVLKGLRLPRLNSGAYDTGVQTGIFGEFDLTFVQYINQLYTLQNAKIQINNSILASVIAKDTPVNDEETSKLFSTIQTSLNDIIAGERDLENFYCEILRSFFSDRSASFETLCADVQNY